MNMRVPVPAEESEQKASLLARSDIVTLATPAAKRAFAEFVNVLFRRKYIVAGVVLFVTALAIPHAYGADRVVFACGYLLVVVVHAGMYVTEAARITRGMVVQLLGWNMLGALLGLVGALFFEDILVWWWLASFVIAVVVPRFVSISSLNQVEPDGGPSFELVPGHLDQFLPSLPPHPARPWER